MQNTTGLSILTAADLLATDLPPRTEVLTPVLACDTAALVYGPTGIGKSFFALGVAWAVASGGSFLGWQAPQPRRVLYVDGELGATELRQRLALFGSPPERLMISAYGLGSGPLLDLSQDDGILRLMESETNDPVNIGNPQEVTIEQIARAIISLVGSKSTIVYRPLPVDDPKQRRPDITRAQTVLRWQPTVGLEEGLRKTVGYFKEKISADR